MTENIRRAVGAIVGTGIGTLGYWFLLQSDIHILAAVGAGTALGVSAAATTTNLSWGLLTAGLAVSLSLLVEFVFRPFLADSSPGYFVMHLGDLPPNSVLSLAAVAVLGLYFGRGRQRRSAPE